MSNRGKPLLATHEDNQCEAATVMTAWKRSKGRDERCPFMGKWSIGGMRLCTHHMRIEAVAYAMEQGKLKRLNIPPPVVGGHVRKANP